MRVELTRRLRRSHRTPVVPQGALREYELSRRHLLGLVESERVKSRSARAGSRVLGLVVEGGLLRLHLGAGAQAAGGGFSAGEMRS
jgi:hypothetical protein